jgi:hypothetical protein
MPGRVISGDVLGTVEHEVLIDLIADGVGVVPRDQIGDEAEFLGREHLSARVHRGVEQDHLGLRPESVGQFCPRQVPVWRRQADNARDCAQHAHHRHVGVVQRLDQDDLVAGIEHGHQARGDRLGGAGGHGNLTRPVDVEVVKALVRDGDGLTQFRDPGHWRILVAAILQRVSRGLDNVCRSLGVGKPLA